VLALGAFLFGYKMADVSISRVLEDAKSRFVGPEEMDLTSRAYLQYPSTREALVAVIDALLEVLRVDRSGVKGSAADTHVVELVRESIESGATAMTLLEPTINCLADYCSGHTAGLRAISADVAARQEASLAGFESWLRREYQQPHARWHAILRVYEGAGIDGLRKFIELWDIFNTLEGKGCS
jgi:hypothetical protein